jgi:hypothetical protein
MTKSGSKEIASIVSVSKVESDDDDSRAAQLGLFPETKSGQAKTLVKVVGVS